MLLLYEIFEVITTLMQRSRRALQSRSGAMSPIPGKDVGHCVADQAAA